MSRIHKLPADVIAKIAAGQVVERPSSVVKELIENSLDAQATSITIKLQDGGRQEITVVDNGVGMSKEDVVLSVAPHTTSKISSLEDLQKTFSYGFRGEALSSMGLVSNMVVQSKEHSASLGYQIYIKHGRQMDHHAVGMASGTIVSVKELFKFYPARKKFLKSAAIELQQVLREVLPIALLHLKVKFRLEHNNVAVFECAAGQTLLERVMLLVGSEYSASLLTVQFEQAGYKIHGFIGVPQIASSARAKQFLWINNRPTSYPLINRSIKSQYGTLLEPRAHPIFFLQITADPQVIDTNVHPRKETIALLEEDIVLTAVTQAVRTTLESSGLAYRPPEAASLSRFALQDSGMDMVMASEIKQAAEPWSVKSLAVTQTTKFFQLHKLYIVVEIPEGVVLIDQHAAHERILYEQFLHAYHQHIQLHQVPLSSPQQLQVGAYQVLSEEKLSLLTSIGISVIENNGKYFITHIPSILQHRNYQLYIAEVLDQYEENKVGTELDSVTRRTLSFLACRSAIKAGEPLTLDEQRNLLEKLLQTNSNYTCPHGRPVFLYLSMNDLADWFKRSGF